MKKILLTLLFLVALTSVFAQETKFQEFSYTEFFNLIENEKDTIFHLKDAIIRYNAETDSSYLFTISMDSTLLGIKTSK